MTPTHVVAKAQIIARLSFMLRAVHSLKSRAVARMTLDVNVT